MWNFSATIPEYTGVGKKIKKDSGEINPLEVHRNLRGCILEVNCEALDHFIDPDMGVVITFRKEGTAENWGIDFEIGDIGTSSHWY